MDYVRSVPNKGLVADVTRIIERIRIAKRRDLPALLAQLWMPYLTTKAPEIPPLILSSQELEELLSEGATSESGESRCEGSEGG